MDLISIFLIGLILGWLVEWVIDWFLWRRENETLTAQLAEANEKIIELETDLMVKTEQLSNSKESKEAHSHATSANSSNSQSNGNGSHQRPIEALSPHLKLLPDTASVYLMDNKEVCSKQGQAS